VVGTPNVDDMHLKFDKIFGTIKLDSTTWYRGLWERSGLNMSINVKKSCMRIGARHGWSRADEIRYLGVGVFIVRATSP